jgi:hypothetical protein
LKTALLIQLTRGRITDGFTGSLRFRKGASANRRYIDVFQICWNDTRKSCLELLKFLVAPNKSVIGVLEPQSECLTGKERRPGASIYTWIWALT